MADPDRRPGRAATVHRRPGAAPHRSRPLRRRHAGAALHARRVHDAHRCRLTGPHRRPCNVLLARRSSSRRPCPRSHGGGGVQHRGRRRARQRGRAIRDLATGHGALSRCRRTEPGCRHGVGNHAAGSPSDRGGGLGDARRCRMGRRRAPRRAARVVGPGAVARPSRGRARLAVRRHRAGVPPAARPPGDRSRRRHTRMARRDRARRPRPARARVAFARPRARRHRRRLGRSRGIGASRRPLCRPARSGLAGDPATRGVAATRRAGAAGRGGAARAARLAAWPARSRPRRARRRARRRGDRGDRRRRPAQRATERAGRAGRAGRSVGRQRRPDRATCHRPGRRDRAPPGRRSGPPARRVGRPDDRARARPVRHLDDRRRRRTGRRRDRRTPRHRGGAPSRPAYGRPRARGVPRAFGE